MDFSSVFPGLVGAIALAATFGVASYLFPSSRWTRQLKRDIEILGGLPDGHERDQWQLKVVTLARRLRAYEKYVPMWQRLAPFLSAVYMGSIVGGLAVSPEDRDALFADQFSLSLGIAAFVGVAGYFWIAIRGGHLSGRDPDGMLSNEEGGTDEAIEDSSEPEPR